MLKHGVEVQREFVKPAPIVIGQGEQLSEFYFGKSYADCRPVGWKTY